MAGLQSAVQTWVELLWSFHGDSPSGAASRKRSAAAAEVSDSDSESPSEAAGIGGDDEDDKGPPLPAGKAPRITPPAPLPSACDPVGGRGPGAAGGAGAEVAARVRGPPPWKVSADHAGPEGLGQRQGSGRVLHPSTAALQLQPPQLVAS